MGLICSETGLVNEIYFVFHKWLGRLPGGLAVATIGGGAVFSAVTGSSLACAATMGKMALPEMKKYKYDPKLATGTIAAGGTLGILIPPSAGFIIYGIITETSIGKLFIAGILPGMLLAFLFMLVIYIRAKLNPSLALPGPKASWHERVTILRSAWPVLALFTVVMGSIYMGVTTPTEAGAIGALGALLISLIRRRLTKRSLITALKDTMHTTGMIFVILIGAMVLNYFLAVSKLPAELANFVATLSWPPHFILMFVIVSLVVMGCIMDALAMILLTMPIFFPIIMALGFDPIWFGVLAVLLIEVGLITPPIGMNVYIVAGIAKDVPLFDIFRGVLPFLVAMIACIAIITLFPQITLLLPTMMR